MGGIVFLITSLICFIIFLVSFSNKIGSKERILLLNIGFYSLLNGMIGLIDDIAKMRKAKNEGLSAGAKFFLQSVAAILFLISLHFSVGIETNVYIPFFNVTVDFGLFYYLISYLLLCGVVNSVNLTDGIDGLAGMISLTVGILFSIVSIYMTEMISLTFISGLITGITLSFLMFNLYPAKIFMGDTGSLFLGGLIVGISFMINNILLVLIYGFVFVCEAATDILQVGYFKITKGKRLFKMAPLHHHLEKSGWSETKIVIILSLINVGFCIISLFGMGNL